MKFYHSSINGIINLMVVYLLVDYFMLWVYIMNNANRLSERRGLCELLQKTHELLQTPCISIFIVYKIKRGFQISFYEARKSVVFAWVRKGNGLLSDTEIPKPAAMNLKK